MTAKVGAAFRMTEKQAGRKSPGLEGEGGGTGRGREKERAEERRQPKVGFVV